MSSNFTIEEKYAYLTAKLKALRDSSGYTQLQVAKIINKPQSYIAKIESGKRRVDVIELHQLASIYGAKVTDFIILEEKDD